MKNTEALEALDSLKVDLYNLKRGKITDRQLSDIVKIRNAITQPEQEWQDTQPDLNAIRLRLESALLSLKEFNAGCNDYGMDGAINLICACVAKLTPPTTLMKE